jgi:cytoskeletal protein RodZ
VRSLGDKLKSTRETKGYTFDYISRETNIAARYLEALETENFAVFPGEPYLQGFLRNYGEYLGLDTDELFSLYRALKIQEQPVPVEQLLRSPSKAPKIILRVLLVLAGLAAAGGGIYFFRNVSWKTRAVEKTVQPQAVYTLEGGFFDRRLYQGDSLLVPLGGNQYKIDLRNLGEAVTLSTPVGAVILDLGQERNVDINSDGHEDIKISVQEFSRSDPSMGVQIRFDIISGGGTLSEAGSGEVPPGEEPYEGSSPETAAANLAGSQVVLGPSNAHPFTLQASFQSYCMFRWELLRENNRQGRQEQYYLRGDSLDIQAQNGVRIWVSNAMAVKLQVIGGGREAPLDIGGAGEVVVAEIRWVRDDDGRFRLRLIRID